MGRLREYALQTGSLNSFTGFCFGFWISQLLPHILPARAFSQLIVYDSLMNFNPQEFTIACFRSLPPIRRENASLSIYSKRWSQKDSLSSKLCWLVRNIYSRFWEKKKEAGILGLCSLKNPVTGTFCTSNTIYHEITSFTWSREGECIQAVVFSLK